MRTWVCSEYGTILFKIGNHVFKTPKHLSMMFHKDECAWLSISFIWSQVSLRIRVARINHVILPLGWVWEVHVQSRCSLCTYSEVVGGALPFGPYPHETHVERTNRHDVLLALVLSSRFARHGLICWHMSWMCVSQIGAIQSLNHGSTPMRFCPKKGVGSSPSRTPPPWRSPQIGWYPPSWCSWNVSAISRWSLNLLVPDVL